MKPFNLAIWIPETCGCRFECQGRNHPDALVAVRHTCQAHTALSGKLLMTTCLAECQVVNFSRGTVAELAPDAGRVSMSFSDDRRMLTYEVPGLNSVEREALADAVVAALREAKDAVGPIAKHWPGVQII